MVLSQSIYSNWRDMVSNLLADPLPTAAGNIFYRVDTSISKVAEAWAVIDPSSPLLVYGSFGNQGPSSATFTTDFTTAVAVTTSISVTE